MSSFFLLRAPVAAAIAAAATVAPSQAFEVNDKVEINGLLAGVGQCQQVSGDDANDTCRGGISFQPEIAYNPTGRDQLYARFAFAAGNSVKDTSPFVLSPQGIDLEDDVKDINGRGRNYLLEAWYAHTFTFSDDSSLALMGGILDPTNYINQNAYANDQNTQFSNEVFINSPNAFIPGYDIGGLLVWNYRDLTFTAVGLNVGENDDGNNYSWYAAEFAYHIEMALGGGNYRLMYAASTNDFSNPTGDAEEGLSGWIASLDQELGDIVGVFLRLGWQAEDAAVDYRAGYSGGLDFKGKAWGREADNIGIGYAYLDGGNTDVKRTNAFEVYYRFVLNETLALTADAQWMSDELEGEDGPEGWIFGLRAIAEF
jgi:hypothetical protein